LNKAKNIDSESASRLKSHRKHIPSVSALIDGVVEGDKMLLARALTLIESNKSEDRTGAKQIVEHCLAKNTNSIRVGITGVPGVGKSTFIEALGSAITATGKRVAVLAVDPSSSISKGSILGDKTRMQNLARDQNAFIRPSPSGDSLGGVARKTRESILLCEAAGFDVILIETVGVGQSETVVHSMVDFFLLLKLAGAGDDLQGIKRGIVEMADAIVINKADGDNIKQADLARVEFERALHMYPPKNSGWIAKALSCSAIKNEGIIEIWQMITDFISQSKANGHLEKNRMEQNKNWFLQTVDNLLKTEFYRSPKTKAKLEKLLNKVESSKISPFMAAEELFSAAKI